LRTNSAAWSIVPSPNRGNGRNTLSSVSCVTPTDCVAVGYSTEDFGIPRTLIESWNGTAWAVTPSLNVGHSGGVFDAISCISGWCMAVGDFGEADVRTFAEWWTANSRVAVAMPNPSNVVNLVTDLSCLSPSRCVAVGSYGRNHAKTLIESWDGTIWSIVPSPNKGDGGALSDVSCTSSARCVAVGYFTNDTKKSGFVTKTLVESN
jgi:hypothetical protein